MDVEVSWPANSSVTTWSRTSRSDKPLAVLAGCRHEHAEDVVGRRRAVLAAALDLAVDDLVQHSRAPSILRHGEPGPRSTRSGYSVP